MKTKHLLQKTLILVAVLLGGVSNAWGGDFNGSNYDEYVTVPGAFDLSYGSYTGFNREAFFSDANIIEYSKSGCTATFKFSVSDAGSFVFSLQASNGNPAGTYNTELSIKIYNEEEEEPGVATQVFTVEDNDNWNDFNYYMFQTASLVAGNYILKIIWSDQANVKSIKLSNTYQNVPSASYFSLEKTAMLDYNFSHNSGGIQGGGNLGYIKNNDYVLYLINNTTEQDYKVIFDAASQQAGDHVSVKVWNADGTTVSPDAVEITNQGADNYNSYLVSLGSLSVGLKVMQIKFTVGDGGTYASNFKNLIVPSVVNITLNANGYATYSTSYDVEVSGATAYTADLDFGNSTITCSEITNAKVPAGNGVLLYGTPNATVTLTPTVGATSLSDNDLKGTTGADGTLATKGSNNYYALNGDTFMPFTGSVFVHHKAYFEVATGVVQARSMRIVFTDNVTGISEASATTEAVQNEGKFVENGKLIIFKNGKKFNAAGQLIY